MIEFWQSDNKIIWFKFWKHYFSGRLKFFPLTNQNGMWIIARAFFPRNNDFRKKSMRVFAYWSLYCFFKLPFHTFLSNKPNDLLRKMALRKKKKERIIEYVITGKKLSKHRARKIYCWCQRSISFIPSSTSSSLSRSNLEYWSCWTRWCVFSLDTASIEQRTKCFDPRDKVFNKCIKTIGIFFKPTRTIQCASWMKRFLGNEDAFSNQKCSDIKISLFRNG